ncbi:MAG: DUF1697 domain-containing protein [Acidobacteria bacterium]|jgi:uncharacterized protein (DUF1697 family)|nr:DUF1697 domain-containing protein [Acidobacteriota bacterium]
MRIFIALFRGINVGGRNILPMKDLRAVLEELGFEGVRTYIQSGNAVCRHAEGRASRLAERISAAIESSHGFGPEVLLLTADELERAMNANPFSEGMAEPSKLHLFFLSAVPADPNLDALEEARAASERFELDADVAYLHAPDGIGRSKLAARLESALGVTGTGRNWRTLCKIMELARTA